MRLFWLELSQALGISVWQTLWQGFIVGGIIYLALKIIPDTKPGLRYFFAYGALIIIFFLFIGNLIHSIPGNIDPQNHAADQSIAFKTDQEKTPTGFQLPSLWENTKHNLINLIYTHSHWISFIWFSGVLISYIRLWIGLSYLKRLRRSVFSAPPDSWKERMARFSKLAGVAAPALMISNKIQSPMTYGWIRPVVLIPACIASGLSIDQVELILLHELAHIKRKDFLTNLILSVVRNFLFFHPVMWWATAIIEEEREKACDDFALSLKNEPVTYIKTLAFTAGSGSAESYAMPVGGQKQLLINRINRIIHLSNNLPMKSQPQPLPQSHFFAALLSFFSLLLIFGFTLGTHGGSFGSHVETQQMTKETRNVLVIELFNDNNRSSLNWAQDKSMIFTSSGEMPAIIFNGKVLPAFKSGEIPDALKHLNFVETQGIMHELSDEEREKHDRKWGNGLVKITLRPEYPQEAGDRTWDLPDDPTHLLDSASRLQFRSSGSPAEVEAPYKEDPQPLYIVDGVITEELDIAPHAIASIEVIKAGELLKLYGEKGKHGVIKVTTKTGKDILEEKEPLPAPLFYPNPSGDQTTVEVTAAEATRISVRVYGLNGELKKTVAEDFFNKGKHAFSWETASWEKGVYIVEVKNGKQTSRHKLVIE